MRQQRRSLDIVYASRRSEVPVTRRHSRVPARRPLHQDPRPRGTSGKPNGFFNAVAAEDTQRQLHVVSRLELDGL